jgi:hypothetical protein
MREFSDFETKPNQQQCRTFIHKERNPRKSTTAMPCIYKFQQSGGLRPSKAARNKENTTILNFLELLKKFNFFQMRGQISAGLTP